jgi:hypothetical protein
MIYLKLKKQIFKLLRYMLKIFNVQISKRFGVSRQNIMNWVSNEDKILITC